VASGAHGRVMECTIKNGHWRGKFAVKRVHGVGGAAAASMERELELLGNLRHDNIAALVGYAREPNGAVVLVMELYDMSLAGLIRERNGEVDNMGWFEGREVIEWLLQIALGLRYLHAEVLPAVAHRDIKTDNCLVELSGIADVQRVLLADFGIGKVLEGSGTLTGQTMAGTPGYMAPEMVSGTYDPLKCDVYAFGILALALLCGVEPATLKMNFGQPLPFELTETARQRIDEDDAFGWLVDHVYEACSACDAALRPDAGAIVLALEDRPV
jgi:serine/threonine protein kinase